MWRKLVPLFGLFQLRVIVGRRRGSSRSVYRPLPSGKLIVGYATGPCNTTQLVREVRAGCNVLIWFSIALRSVEGAATITGGPEASCVVETRRVLDGLGYGDVAHMISIGGWDAIHPNATVANGTEWWRVFAEWNAAGSKFFDGIDWDVEGNDDLASDENVIPTEVLALMQTMSAAAKDAGALVSLVPAQSYLDPSATGFDFALNHSYADWYPDFYYRGLNTYAPLVIARPELFDFVSVQFYESWSRCAQAVEEENRDPADYLVDFVSQVAEGWQVDFGQTRPLGLQGRHVVRLDLRKLVLGFSTGTNVRGKMIYVDPRDVGRAYDALTSRGLPFRGAMFWNTRLDFGPNCYLPNGTNTDCNLARGFNDFLHVRSPSSSHRRGGQPAPGKDRTMAPGLQDLT